MRLILQEDQLYQDLTSLTRLLLKLVNLEKVTKESFNDIELANLRTSSLFGCDQMAVFLY